jgi:hypothetical protein
MRRFFFHFIPALCAPLWKTSYLLTRENKRGFLRADFSLTIAKAFAGAGYHKQIFNRVVEPYSYIDTLFSTTSLANFNHLRRDKAAEPHMRDLAEAIYIADNESPVQYTHTANGICHSCPLWTTKTLIALHLIIMTKWHRHEITAASTFHWPLHSHRLFGRSLQAYQLQAIHDGQGN